MHPKGATPDQARTFGRWTLLAELGRGGMGTVWSARDGAGREVAIKVMSAGWSEEDLTRFRREAALARELTHEGIVRVLEWGVEHGTPFLAMELVQGESLEARVRRTGPLPPEHAAQIALDLARALAHAHSRGVLHRDVKPANVIIDPLGRARLVDFGLARRIEQAQPLTRTGELIGTPATMAPEQVRGERELDERTDVYGIGATLFTALTGQPPFQGASWIAVMEQVLTRAAPAPGSLVPGLDRSLEAICLRCLEKERERRFAGARELATALSDWSRRSAWTRAHGVVAAGTLAGLGALAAWFAHPWPASATAPAAVASSIPPSRPVPAPVSSADDTSRSAIALLDQETQLPPWERVLQVGRARLARIGHLGSEGHDDEAARELASVIEQVDEQLHAPATPRERSPILDLWALRVTASRMLGGDALEEWLSKLDARQVLDLGSALKNDPELQDVRGGIAVLEWATKHLSLEEPGRSDVEFDLGGLYSRDGRKQDALDAYARCIDHPWAPYRRMEVLLELDRLPEAKQQILDVPEWTRDTHPEGWAQLARITAMLGEDEQSEQALDRLAGLRPETSGAKPADLAKWQANGRLYRLIGLVDAERWAEARALRDELGRSAHSQGEEWRAKLAGMAARIDGRGPGY